jgi:hypothetical protein
MRGTLLAGMATGVAVALRRARNRGAEPAELVAELPGDDLIPEPADVTTRAVDIEAPADRVWHWLVQMGQDRGGMYGYDWLETPWCRRVGDRCRTATG